MKQPELTPPGMTYLAHWTKLDAMCRAGEGDSEAADSLLDLMDPFWYQMTQEDHRRIEAYFVEVEAAIDAGTYP